MVTMIDTGIPWIGKIPETWCVRRLQYVLHERKEKNDPLKTDNILSLSAAQGVIPYSERQSGGNKPKEDLTAYKVVHEGDIVMNSMNVLSGAVNYSRYMGCVSPVYYMLYNDDDIVTRYYNLVFQTDAFQKSLRGLGNGILIKETEQGKLNTIRTRIPMEKLNKVLLPLPQYRDIVDIVENIEPLSLRLDEIIAEAEKSIEEYKELKQAVIFEAVTKGLDKNVPMKDSGIDWIGEIPESSRFVKLKYLVKRPITDGTHQTPDYDNAIEGSPFLSSKDVTKGYIDWSKIKYITQKLHEKLQKEIAPKRDDILLAKNGTTGVAAIVDTDKVFDIYVTLAVIRPNKNAVIPEYLLHAINSYASKRQFDDHLIGIGVPNLHLNVINNTKVIVHSKENQKRIIDYLKARIFQIDSLIYEKQSLIEDLQAYKKSLIYEVVTGKRRVV